MLRAGVAFAVALLGPVFVYVMSKAEPVSGCSTPVDRDAAILVPVEAGIEGEASHPDAAEADDRRIFIPRLDAGDEVTPVPL